MQDLELIESIRAGDPEAFGELMDRYQGMVYGLCYRMTGNSSDAEELAHDAFVEAYLKLDQLRDLEHFAGWLRTLALNLCRLWYRQRKIQFVSLDEEVPAPSDDDNGNEILLTKMAYGLSQLLPPQRLVLVLHYFEGLSYEETAAFLELPIGTIMSRLHRARQALKKLLTEMGELTETITEEMNIMHEEQFREEILAEISVLLRMFEDDPKAAERLKVILLRSPERIRQLIRETDDESLLSNFALLLSRLGKPGFEVILQSLFSQDEQESVHAAFVIRAFLGRMAIWGGKHAKMFTMPQPEVYLLTESLIDSPVPDSRKVEALMDWMEGSRDRNYLISLWGCLLFCYGDVAYSALIEELKRHLSSENGTSTYDILFPLSCFGTRFLRDLLEITLDANPSRQPLALSRIEAIIQRWGYSLVLSAQWDPSPETLLLDSRIGRNPPPDYRDAESPVRQELMEQLATLMGSDRADIRQSVIRILGKSRSGDHIPKIRPYLADAQLPVRIEAIRALSELGDMESADPLLLIAQTGESLERKVAAEALARIKVPQAIPTLIQLAEGPDPEVREAAAIALRETGGEEADAALVRLSKSSDKRVRKVAINAVYWKNRPQPPKRVDTVPSKWKQMVEGAHAGTYDSLLPVFFLMLPEVRPYKEDELSRLIAKVCADYSGARRKMIEFNFMTRAYTPGVGHVYEFTEIAKTIWRVENHIRRCLEQLR